MRERIRSVELIARLEGTHESDLADVPGVIRLLQFDQVRHRVFVDNSLTDPKTSVDIYVLFLSDTRRYFSHANHA